eukprot:3629658-Ditylum_brightwellii.AAC.1
MSSLCKQVVRHTQLNAPNPYVVPIPMPTYPVIALSMLFPSIVVSSMWKASPLKPYVLKVANERA